MNKDSDKTKEQLLADLSAVQAELAELRKKSKEREDKLKAANQQLDAHNQQLQASERILKELKHQLNVRVKELNCLYGISKSVETRETTEEILQDVTEVIPPGWQYPQITGCKITLWDKEYKTEYYKDSQWKLSSDISVNKKIAGKIEVCYLEKKPESDIGPFLNEERILLDTIAERLGRIIERRNAEEALKELNQELEERVRKRTAELAAANQQLQASEQQLRATNRQLKAREKKLLESNKELQQFAYVASHDLKEPLRMVSSYTQLLERRYKDKLDDKAQKFIAYAVDGANRMQSLIDDLLQFSRVETQGEEFVKTDANMLLGNVLSGLENSIKENNAVITTDQLPEIYVDKTQIERVFQNLISNDIKFRKKDQEPRIHISARKDKNKWLFSVKDNGIGIDKDFTKKVFIIFQRLHSRSEYEGTGIGLAVSKKIIARHGGKLWFESELGKGTTFYFTLPVKKI